MRVFKSKRESTEGNQKCATFRISQLQQSVRHSSNTRPDKRSRFNLPSCKSILKLSTKRTIGQSARNLRGPSSALFALHKLVKINSSEYTQLIARQIQISRRRKLVREYNQNETLTTIFQISERMHEEVYSYGQVEADVRELHVEIKKLGSSTFTYRTYAFAGFVLFEYGSFSLSLYYFDRALKHFYDRQNTLSYHFQSKLELQIYKFVCRIFLSKSRYPQAKNFAYKLLRKAWLLPNLDQQMAAYDLLGKIYMEHQSMTMCQYFHWRMRSGEKESPQILTMSKQQMNNQKQEQLNFVCYETINIFVDKDAHFNDILENHYRVRSLEHAKEVGQPEADAKNVFVYTHHSPNRELKNYHLLERKMIEAKESKELHFIRPKDSYRLKRLFSDFSALVHQLTQKVQTIQCPTEFSIPEETPQEGLLSQ